MIADPEAYRLRFFLENGFIRKECSHCGRHFWTLDPDAALCGDSPCVPYSFIGDPPTKRKFTVAEMREAFLSFFERNNHTRVRRYPVVARWRDDIFLTIASIACFQPHVTSGDVPPPFNPLTISQPCIRMNDLDNVGKTGGRHMTIFEMMAHHAFSSKEKEVYWKEDTVRYHHELLTKDLGIKGEEITYIEHWWEGGGDAGPDLEGMVRGIELSTLVFMQYKRVGDNYRELPIRIVDTGYGLERFAWVSQGTPTAFEAVYGSLMRGFMEIAGVEEPDPAAMAEATRYAGLMNVVDAGSLKEARSVLARRLGMDVGELERAMSPIEALTAVLDHTKALVFMLSDGVVPSNVQAGYLARLMIRRTKRQMDSLRIKVPLSELLKMQIDYWRSQFPDLASNADYVMRVADLEVGRYEKTVDLGKSLIGRIVRSEGIAKSGVMPLEKLIELYDSNGLPPEVVKEVSEAQGVKVEIPDTFDTIVADRHSGSADGGAKKSEERDILEGIPQVQATEAVYYSKPKLRSLSARVLYADDRRVVLDRTIFYPEGGGQLSDRGTISSGGKTAQVMDAQRSRGVVVHFTSGEVDFRAGDEVECKVDWERRMSLARHHSSTHILLGAARAVLGGHVWQEGAQKDVDRSRLDISHFEKISRDQLKEIELIANRTVEECRPIKAYFEDRNRAEQSFGLRLYQGGVVYGPTIRVVEVEGWDVEACGGIHCENTGEIGLIKILKSERIQDGVERLEFASGQAAVRAVQEMESALLAVAENLSSPVERVVKASEKVVCEISSSKKDIERLRRSMAAEIVPILVAASEPVGKVRFAFRAFESLNSADLIAIASCAVSCHPEMAAMLYSKADNSVLLMAGEWAVNRGFNAGKALAMAASSLGGKGGGKPDIGQGRIPAEGERRLSEAALLVKGMLEKLY